MVNLSGVFSEETGALHDFWLHQRGRNKWGEALFHGHLHAQLHQAHLKQSASTLQEVEA